MVLASSAGDSRSIASTSLHTSANGSSRVLHARSVFMSDGSFPAATYRRAVFRSMPAFIAAMPTFPCLVISSISFLTWASLTGRTGRSSLGRTALRYGLTRPLPMGRCSCRPWGDVVVAQQAPKRLDIAVESNGLSWSASSTCRKKMEPCATVPSGVPSVSGERTVNEAL